MDSQKVALKKCDTYNQLEVDTAVKEALDLLGGIENYITPGQKVFLKLNLLMKKKPEEAVTTHPVVVEAVVKLLQAVGATVTIGDSPGGPYNAKMLKGVYKACGIEAVASRTGAKLNDNYEEVKRSHPQGKLMNHLVITKAIADADVVISLSKLKTHQMTRFTGAVKVMFGAIPGLKKAEYHLNLPDIKDFSNMLLDIVTLTKPVISIMDGVIGMEGHGPSAGDPRQVGAILASENPMALDVVAVSLVGIEPSSIPTIQVAEERGMISSLKQIEILGNKLQDFNVISFKAPKISGVSDFPIPEFIKKRVHKVLKPIPIFISEDCIKCGDCAANCPPKVLTMGKEKPEIDIDKCIRCFCCQELCPKKAVKVKRSWLSKALHRF